MKLIDLMLPVLGLVVAVATSKLGHHEHHGHHGHHTRDQAETTTQIPIVRMNNVQNDDGSFQYGYQTANRIQTAVEGYQKVIGDGVGTVMQGRYSFISPEGRNVRVTWVADEDGFRAFGDTLALAPLE